MATDSVMPTLITPVKLHGWTIIQGKDSSRHFFTSAEQVRGFQATHEDENDEWFTHFVHQDGTTYAKDGHDLEHLVGSMAYMLTCVCGLSEFFYERPAQGAVCSVCRVKSSPEWKRSQQEIDALLFGRVPDHLQ